jgi:hypothetical protein
MNPLQKISCSVAVALGMLCAMTGTANAQIMAKVQVDRDIPGLCDTKEVHALFPMFGGQQEAFCSMTKADVQAKLNDEVLFLKQNPGYKNKHLMVQLWVNCKGELVLCEMDGNGKSGKPALDEQILAVMRSLTGWHAGSLNGKAVDSLLLWSMVIKKGVLTIG